MKKLLDKYKTMPAPAKASLWFIVCGFLQKGIAFITTPVFTRIMTEEAYGQYSSYIAWMNIFTIIASLNLSAGVYTRGLVKNEDDEAGFSSSMATLSTVCISIVFLAVGVCYNVVSRVTDLSVLMLVIMFIEIWETAVFHFWSNKERVNYRYKKLVVLTLVYVLFSQMLSVIAVLNVDVNKQVEARAISIATIGFVIFVPMYIKIIKKGKKCFSKDYWIYALKFNLPLVPHYLSQIVLNESDKLMIKSICGANYTGYYSVAYSVSMIMLIFNNSVSGVMNPWIYKSIKNGNYKKIGQISYYILAVIAIMNFFVITVAPEALTIIAPGSYQQALWAMPPVTASVYFMFLYNLFATFEYYYEKTNYVMISSVLCAVANIVLNYLFIPKYGFIAAGYTTLTCYILVSLLHYMFMRKTCNRFMGGVKIYNFKIILAIGFFLIVAGGFMTLLYPWWYIRYAVILCAVVTGFMFRKKIISLFLEFRKNGEN